MMSHNNFPLSTLYSPLYSRRPSSSKRHSHEAQDRTETVPDVDTSLKGIHT